MIHFKGMDWWIFGCQLPVAEKFNVILHVFTSPQAELIEDRHKGQSFAAFL
jgi:hypothetical protein